MRLLADRFLLDDGDAVDLATGETVRLAVEHGLSSAELRDRVTLCDALASLRHPLLVPLVDYGADGDRWFEVHAPRGPYRTSLGGARDAALHLVRFLQAHAVTLPSRAVSRHVRPAIEASEAGGRIFGYRLASRGAIETVRGAIEAGGLPGVTRVTLHGPLGSGLHTARMLLARAARLAGYFVLDMRLADGAGEFTRGRHCCVIDWLPLERRLPPILANPATAASAHHVWLRFTRERSRDDAAVELDPLTTSEMTDMIYRDTLLGPTDEQLRTAIHEARGWPGRLLDRLASTGSTTVRAGWVHETSPAYVVERGGYGSPRPPVEPETRAGLARLRRVFEAAQAVAVRGRHARAERLLRKCARAFEARHAGALAADAHTALGELLLRRGRATEALGAFAHAAAVAEGDRGAAVLLATGRALTQLGRSEEAAATLRTLLAGDCGDLAPHASAALGRVLLERGDPYAATDVLQRTGGAGTAEGALVQALVARASGDVAEMVHAARRAAGAAAARSTACEAHVVLVEAHVSLGDRERAREAAAAAAAAARDARDPGLQLLARAAASLCVEDSVRHRVPPHHLLRACRRLPPFRAGQVRRLLEFSSVERPQGPGDPGRTLEMLVGICVDAGDETAAAAAIADHLKTSLGGCSAALWTADGGRQVALAGRAWPDGGFARRVMNAGEGAERTGVAPEAAEPIRAGAATVGCVAVRWAPGCAPPPGQARRVLRLAAAAVAPAMLLLNQPAPRVPVAAGIPDELFGRGPRADALRVLIARAAMAPFHVLVEGESGSGKELVARAIHARSARRTRRFCAVNCAAFTEDLLEAELFGHARGAFTGAAVERQGVFEEADQGTLFLDEVAELSPRAQAKLLRALQDGEVRRVGENLARRVDVRIVAATNRPLDREVEAGRFRADLRFRLDVVKIVVPPLRERADEIPALVDRIWTEAAARVGTRATLGAETVAALARYEWPGNVRELQNVLAALAVHAPARGRVPLSLLAPRIAECLGTRPSRFDDARREFERRFVRAALARAAWRKRAAAAELGVSRQGLDKMLKRLGIVEAR